MHLLITPPQAAREIAFMLHCEYDGCNGITLPSDFDVVAVRTAIALMVAQYCLERDALLLPTPVNLTPDTTAMLDEDELAEQMFQDLMQLCML
jgi:hypothetical protein